MISVPRNPTANSQIIRKIARVVLVVSSASLCIGLLSIISQQETRVVQASTKNSKQVGATLFHAKGCEHCHGVGGQDGDRGPDLRAVGKRLTKQQIERQIRNGGAEMPAFNDALSADEVSNLVEMLHARRGQ